MITTANKWGVNCIGIRLSKNLLDVFPVADKTPLKIEVDSVNDRLIITRVKQTRKYPTIEELFADFDGEYESVDIDWGKPVGDEVW
jgi:antitoxin component of MazEF toxin-antitoxin module